ncbi:NAD-dependent epimerase/dehydratase family protein [Aestuariispira insulae]|uniref:CDP-paratose 2-epimerase n=1 Tax=Aestuariispira insulae TaxID=1461337 RepID=A0A3D9H3Y2_9PROT|nr:NAD-dependent epimerase/dehydratase family protein [Aestuariispira insulae]RED44190.1 CDP-paratose 2-epimerase [Aestuariispira insulae]
MTVAIITGSSGLVGAEACRFYAAKGYDVVGIDNDMRQSFFGKDASTQWSRQELERDLKGYQHAAVDIRDREAVDALFARFKGNIAVVIHAAAQPSHDWAASDPITDFTVNANGTMVMLEACRAHAPDAAFIYCSTNKVYGDTPNSLPLMEVEGRWELDPTHPYAAHGIDEEMSLDRTKHSLFGVSKASADLMVQEYGRYFGMKTACFRAGCITGAGHSGAQLHGFLSYLMRCAITGTPYTIFGYKGKQVRDNIHAHDLVSAFWHFGETPSRPGVVYNIGGSRHANCSILEAIAQCEDLTGREMNWTYSDENRIGDHVWWISDVRRFQADYPDWSFKYDLKATLSEMHDVMKARLAGEAA